MTASQCQEGTYAVQQEDLLDHLVGEREQSVRHVEAEHSGRLNVDDQLEFGRLHNRQVRGFHAFEDPAGIAFRDQDIPDFASLNPGYGLVDRPNGYLPSRGTDPI